MSYLVLARKYRPKTFDEVVGQEHVTNALKSAIAANKVAHAFLFSGPRGVGKTTCARILAKEINKAAPQQDSGTMDFGGENMDVIEIDGASNRGIDEARAIRESAMFMAMSGGYKFYIIDEVHMLTEPAFNALLKTLEEPPEHVKFIFATTDPEKVPTTIRSRCQHFHFKRLSMDVIKAQLKSICKTESLTVDDEALFAIARAAQGGMRDALGILDQLAAGGEKVGVNDANSLLGLIDVKYIFDIADGLIRKDVASVMACIETVVNSGKDDRRLLRDMVEHFRNILMMKVDAEKLQGLVDYPAFYRKQLFEQAGELTIENILKVMDIFIAAKDTERLTDAPRLALELALVKSAVMLSGPAAVNVPAPKAVVPPATVRPAPLPVSAPTPKVVNVPVKPASSVPTSSVAPVATAVLPSVFSLLQVKQRWDEMTAAVQDKKTYLGSCLLEGAPVSVSGRTLTIAFPKSCEYQKESLEEIESMKLVTSAFAAVMGQEVKVVFTVMDGAVTRDNSEALQNALDSFQGEVINEWHNEA
jgi:DNA polymerase-3 subunit gamma/tau